MKEVFVPIKGYSGYTISNYGRVFSAKSNTFLTLSKPYPTANLYVNVYKKGKTKHLNVSTLVYRHFQVKKRLHDYAIHIDLERENNFERNLLAATWGDLKREAARIKGKRRGVYKWKQTVNGKTLERYRAMTKYNNKVVTLGYAKTKEEAEQIYYAGYHQLFGKYPYEANKL